MHRLAIALIPAHYYYGKLQEDYHSVTANPSFGCHGTRFPFTAPYGLRVGKQSSSPTLVSRHGLVFPDENYGSASLFNNNECI